MFHPSPPPLPVANIHYIGIYPLTMIHLLLSVQCCPTNSHIHPSPLFLHFIHAPLPPCLSHLQILLRVCDLKLCRQHHQCQLINFPFLLRGSTFNMQSSQSSYQAIRLCQVQMLLHQCLHSMRANALFSLPSYNLGWSQWTHMHMGSSVSNMQIIWKPISSLCICPCRALLHLPLAFKDHLWIKWAGLVKWKPKCQFQIH